MAIFGAIIGLVIVFYWLAKICDEYFVKSLEVITQKLKISEDVSGASFMAIGSSAPELFTAIIALSKVGIENVGTGTIVGSAIFNVLVIIGASAMVKEIFVSRVSVLRDIGVYLGALILLIFTFWDGVITLQESILYIILYALYIFILSQWKKWVPTKKSIHIPIEEITEKLKKLTKKKTIWDRIENWTEFGLKFLFLTLKPQKQYGWVFGISILYIAILSYIMVELAVFFAHGIGVPEAIIALTILAAGTSVPDMISSIVATKKGYGNMAISNAIGSNSFDILIGLGLPWLIFILLKGQDIEVGTENLMSSIILLFGTVLLLALILIGKKFSISKTEGILLVGIYLVYIVISIFLVFYPDFFKDFFPHLNAAVFGI
jgi:K+-dependent Na+/Ca+ exchanger-like protein